MFTVCRSLAQLSLLFGQAVRGVSAGARVFEVHLPHAQCLRLIRVLCQSYAYMLHVRVKSKCSVLKVSLHASMPMQSNYEYLLYKYM